ncbi:MAG: glycosyltransferase [Deltaproteobacteria bacterium]|nr:glycosyltransferase [Deltaproteobacteria bacterium]
MTIFFHHTAAPLGLRRLDAVIQEIDFLQYHFQGRTVLLRPRLRAKIPFPRALFGFQHLPWLRRQESGVDFHHVFNPDLYLFPVLKWLKRPIIYSPVAGVSKTGIDPPLSLKRHIEWIVVNNRRDWERLQRLGFHNLRLIPPGFDRSRFTVSRPPLGDRLNVLVGSSPWNLSQFQSKGVDTLLAAAQKMSNLRLVFLWRGFFVKEMEKRIKAAGVTDQVELINEAVDVNRVLAGVHAGIVLAERTTLVKGYPNSLMEALAAGKPILVSRCIAMADLVEETGCGLVFNDNSLDEVVQGFQNLKDGYREYQEKALEVGRDRFSLSEALEGYRDLYGAMQQTRP